jgi:hypothetical protein
VELTIVQKLAEKTVTKEQLFKAVEKDFELLPLVMGGVSSSKVSVRYSCASVLVDLTAKHPEKLYPHMDFFTSLLDSKHLILVWNGLASIANLCSVDVDKKFDAIFDKYYGFLGDEYMVTVANVVGNSGKIALAKPYLTARITSELLRVGKLRVTPHLTDECRRVIAEKAVETFDTYFDQMGSEEKVKVVSFVKKYRESSRASLRKDAEAFLKRRSI